MLAAAVSGPWTSSAFLLPAGPAAIKAPRGVQQTVVDTVVTPRGGAGAWSPRPASPRREGAGGSALWARRKRKGDSDADFERFDLDELRDEKRFEDVEEMDPDVFRPSKMEYYVPAPTDIEHWDVCDTK